jgi:hypothetical protein
MEIVYDDIINGDLIIELFPQMFNEFFEVPNLYPIIHINYISEKLSQKKL